MDDRIRSQDGKSTAVLTYPRTCDRLEQASEKRIGCEAEASFMQFGVTRCEVALTDGTNGHPLVQ